MRAFRKYIVALVILVLVPLCTSILAGQKVASGQNLALSSTRDPEQEFQIAFRVFKFILENYLDEVNVERVIRGAIKGMVESLGDPYSVYMEPSNYQDFVEEMEGSFEGIGINITVKDGYVTVVAPLKGSPAEKAGIRPGDVILGVDGKGVKGLSTTEVSRLIKGPKGSRVVLKVSRRGVGEFDVTVMRDTIELDTVDFKLLGDGIGYIEITMFNEQTGREFTEALTKLKSLGMKGLVLDLRNNPGGLLEPALSVAEHFVPEGPIVYVVTRFGDKKTLRSSTPAEDYPLCVLVNGGTASAAEIVAGAIQDWQTGTVVGTRTFGKGTVQTVINLGGRGGLRLTTAEYLTPAGRSIRDVGLVPDVVVENGSKAVTSPPDPMELTRELKPGMIGLDVLALQERLSFLKFSPGPLDGIYGSLTKKAVLELQRRIGLRQSGHVDEQTVIGLNRLLVESSGKVGLQDHQLDKAVEIVRTKITRDAA